MLHVGVDVVVTQIGFALQALQEIPEQYQIIRRLKLMDPQVGAKYFKRMTFKSKNVIDLFICALLSK